MKKIALLFGLFFPLFVSAQVKVLNEPVAKPKAKPIEKYDSLSNISSFNWEQLVGQTLFLNSTKGASSKWSAFLFDNIEKRGELNFNDYYHHNLYVKSRGTNYLELIDTLANKTLYLFPNGTLFNNEYYDQFLVVGYYEKMKKLFIGQTFYCTDDYSHFKTVNGDRINNIQFKVPFKCIDVYASPNPFSNTERGYHFLLKAIVESSKYGKLIVDITQRFKEENEIPGFVSARKYNRLIKKYGQVNGKKVALHQAEIGMTESMVLDSWGAPEKINETSGRSGSEQWIYYGNHYLYFRNGRLVDRQRF